MIGYQYDSRALKSQAFSKTFLMFPRYKEATPTVRMQRAVRRQGVFPKEYYLACIDNVAFKSGQVEKKRAEKETTGLSPRKKKAKTANPASSQPKSSQKPKKPKTTVPKHVSTPVSRRSRLVALLLIFLAAVARFLSANSRHRHARCWTLLSSVGAHSFHLHMPHKLCSYAIGSGSDVHGYTHVRLCRSAASGLFHSGSPPRPRRSCLFRA